MAALISHAARSALRQNRRGRPRKSIPVEPLERQKKDGGEGGGGAGGGVGGGGGVAAAEGRQGQFVRLEAETEKESDGGRARSSARVTAMGDIAHTNSEAEDDAPPPHPAPTPHTAVVAL